MISERMSSRPMGWCRKGADMLSHIRIYWKSGSNMLEVVQTQEKIKMEEKAEGENYFSASEMLSWENRHRKTNGKYIEALCASIANCQWSPRERHLILFVSYTQMKLHYRCCHCI